MTARARCTFRGHVQGVYFRAHCQEHARSLRLTGWVRNRPDGTVEAVFEGEKARIEEAIEWNRSSQPYARVADVDVVWEAPRGAYADFVIRR
jgi:acylphosphatase